MRIVVDIAVEQVVDIEVGHIAEIAAEEIVDIAVEQVDIAVGHIVEIAAGHIAGHDYGDFHDAGYYGGHAGYVHDGYVHAVGYDHAYCYDDHVYCYDDHDCYDDGLVLDTDIALVAGTDCLAL